MLAGLPAHASGISADRPALLLPPPPPPPPPAAAAGESRACRSVRDGSALLRLCAAHANGCESNLCCPQATDGRTRRSVLGVGVALRGGSAVSSRGGAARRPSESPSVQKCSRRGAGRRFRIAVWTHVNCPKSRRNPLRKSEIASENPARSK